MANVDVRKKLGSPSLIYNAGLYEETNSFIINASLLTPTPGAGATFYRRTIRDGRVAKIRWEYKQTAAGSNGSGAYILNFPTGIVADLNYISKGGITLAGATYVGDGFLVRGAVYADVKAYLRTSSSIGIMIDNQGASDTSYVDFGSGKAGLGDASNESFTIEIEIPVVGWDLTEYVAVGAGFNPSGPSLVNGKDSGTFVAAVTGPFGSQNINVEWSKIDRQVILNLPGLSVAATTGSIIQISTTNMPSKLRPTLQKDLLLKAISGSVNTLGFIRVPPSSDILAYASITGGSFAASGNAGFESTALTYMSAS